jgi:hypothetical protein
MSLRAGRGGGRAWPVPLAWRWGAGREEELAADARTKIGSTGYRMVRYYRGSPPYREKGPPQLVLRAVAPGVVLSTLAVVGPAAGEEPAYIPRMSQRSWSDSRSLM